MLRYRRYLARRHTVRGRIALQLIRRRECENHAKRTLRAEQVGCRAGPWLGPCRERDGTHERGPNEEPAHLPS